ncbi:flagellar hook-length control protein FliK [Oceanisphaera sp. W20_SRM_FM3]|uniref:flagellar hook-length control protein FliK n=1 Tax=Oceanisphaera sp. W20_SRM_FM3 TaxID=3240267 RepID=UPI003F946C30
MMGLPASAGPQTASQASGRNSQVAAQTPAANGFADQADVSNESDFAESLAESVQQASSNQSKAPLEASAPKTTVVNDMNESAASGLLGEETLNAELGADPNVDSNAELNVDLVAGVSTELPLFVTASELDVLANADALAEPATQLWHWHYSRGVGSEQIGSTAFGKMAAMVDAMAGKTSGEAGEMPTANAQAAASQAAIAQTALGQVVSEPVVPGQVVSGQAASKADATVHAEGALLQAASATAERRLGFSATVIESSQAPITQLAANKVLQQQLASGSTSIATVKVEEASHSLTSSGAHVTSHLGRASVPIHEWAPVAVDSTNKAQLGAQLLHTLKEKVELQLNQEVQQARIKLDPPEMGRLELSIRLEGDKLHIHIAASQGAVRDALNAHADRLRNDLLPHHSGGVEVSVGQDDASPQEDNSQDETHQGEGTISIAEREAAALERQGASVRGWVNALV